MISFTGNIYIFSELIAASWAAVIKKAMVAMNLTIVWFIILDRILVILGRIGVLVMSTLEATPETIDIVAYVTGTLIGERGGFVRNIRFRTGFAVAYKAQERVSSPLPVEIVSITLTKQASFSGILFIRVFVIFNSSIGVRRVHFFFTGLCRAHYTGGFTLIAYASAEAAHATFYIIHCLFLLGALGGKTHH